MSEQRAVQFGDNTYIVAVLEDESIVVALPGEAITIKALPILDSGALVGYKPILPPEIDTEDLELLLGALVILRLFLKDEGGSSLIDALGNQVSVVSEQQALAKNVGSGI